MSEIVYNRAHPAPPRSDIGLAWFLKRTVMAVVILGVSIGGIAWLLHSSIDPTAEARAADNQTVNAAGLTGSIAPR